ncbi:CD63 antigen [Venturia canescens]|uniref:CD63 antigen n=1 Tax=Venturia canescens TaxID=32260 RepID=UPI001C9D3D4E|nr:CD63 antigen [Venturia canescens]
MESCGMSLIKYILFIFNLIFAISGIAIIAAGALVVADVGQFSHFLEGRIIAPPIVLIVAGCIVFFIAFFGCFGAIKENYTMLMIFAVALLLIFIVEMAVGIAAAVFKRDFEMILRNSMKDSLGNYTDADRVAWDKMQTNLECCGVDGPGDWEQLSISGITQPGFLPQSCCKDLRPNSSCRSFDVLSLSQTGCYAALENRVHKGASVLIGVGIGIAFIEVAGIVFACCLAITIKKEAGAK